MLGSHNVVMIKIDHTNANDMIKWITYKLYKMQIYNATHVDYIVGWMQ